MTLSVSRREKNSLLEPAEVVVEMDHPIKNHRLTKTLTTTIVTTVEVMAILAAITITTTQIIISTLWVVVVTQAVTTVE